MAKKRHRKPTSSMIQKVECLKIWLKDKGLEGNLIKDKFPKEELK